MAPPFGTRRSTWYFFLPLSIAKAWSSVIQSLVPDSQRLQRQLNSLAEFTECDELVLFERNTFLVLASSENSLSLDPYRFEKISNTIKQFKIVTTRYRSSYEGFTIRDGNTIICMKPITEFTSIMVISSTERTSGFRRILRV